MRVLLKDSAKDEYQSFSLTMMESLVHHRGRNSTETALWGQLGLGWKFKVPFPDEVATHSLTLEPPPATVFTILCAPPRSDVTVSSILQGLGSLPNQR